MRLIMKKKYKELEHLLWEKGSVCVVLCYNSDLLQAILVNGAIHFFVTGATDIIIVICSKPCSANC